MYTTTQYSSGFFCAYLQITYLVTTIYIVCAKVRQPDNMLVV